MNRFIESIAKKVINIIKKTTNAKKSSGTTTIKNITPKEENVVSSNLFPDFKEMVNDISNNTYSKISGKNELKGVLFTKMINETNEIIDEANQNRNKILNNLI